MRDRATLYVEQLSGKAGGVGALVEKAPRLPLKNLEAALQIYLAGSTEVPFDLDAVPEDVIEEDVKKAGPSQATGAMPGGLDEAERLSEYVEQLKRLPQLATFGALFKSCDPVQLTEEGTEYNVTLIKHIFASHIVFQFSCTNTVAEQVLEDVKVLMDLAETVSEIC